MDTVAFSFCNDVSSLLPNESLQCLTHLQGHWPRASAEHLARRVFLQIRIRPGVDNSLEYVLICRGERMSWSKSLSLENLKNEAVKYLKIESLQLGEYTWPRDSWKKMDLALIPFCASFVDQNSEFTVENVEKSDILRPVVEELRVSRHFRKLHLHYSGLESEQMLNFQLSHGKLDSLRLSGSWPQKTLSALQEFCRSSKMCSLDISNSGVQPDLTLIRILVNRFVNGGFKRVVMGQIFEGRHRETLTFESVRDIHPDMIPTPHRNSKKFVSWKDPSDERRLRVQRSNDLFVMEIC